MDRLDGKLLTELMGDSRQSLTRLAKRVGASREVAAYRVGRLKKEGVIAGFITEVDMERLGFVGTAIFVAIKATRSREFREFIEKQDFVSWVAEYAGVWSFGFSIWGRTNGELDERFMGIYRKFKDDIIDYRVTLHRRNTFFYEKYFQAQPQRARPGRHVEYTMDGKDRIILKELAGNSRMGFVELGKKAGLTAPAVGERVRRLRQAGYIRKYSVFVDVSKLGLFQYSVFIISKSIDERGRLLAYLARHPKVNYVAEYVGDPFLEFGIFVEDPYQLRGILQGIEGAFPENRVVEVSLYQKELVSVSPPGCVFERA